jgi:hypothetical protein
VRSQITQLLTQWRIISRKMLFLLFSFLIGFASLRLEKGQL